MTPELFSQDHDEVRAFSDYTKALVGTDKVGRNRLPLQGNDRRKSFPSDSPGETTTEVNRDNGAVCIEQLPE